MSPQPSLKKYSSITGWGSLRDAITCLSLANISFARVWQETLSFRQSDTYFMRQVPSRADYVAEMIAVLLLAAVFYGAVWLCRRRAGRLYPAFRFASFFLIFLPLNSLRGMLGPSHAAYLKAPALQLLTWRTLTLFVLPVSIVTIGFVWRWQQQVTKFAVALLVSTFPFCFVTFGQAAVILARGPVAQPRDGALAPRLAAAKPSPRVVWVIFDEWDYRLSFVDRPPGVALPEIDRFRRESLFGTRAHSPSMFTATSLPTLLTGREMQTKPQGGGTSDSLTAEEVDGVERVPWKKVETAFSVARRAGFNTGLVGWYLPYCRMLNNVLCDCAWWPMPFQANSTGDTVLEKIAGQTISTFETDSLSPFGQSLTVRHKARMYGEFLAEAKRQAGDGGLGLVLLHVPVPHAPHPYNTLTGRFDLKNRPMQGYIDSLALVDNTWGELRREMEARGTWNRTTILLSSDHPFRTASAIDGKPSVRVPFLLHFPGQAEPASFDDQFNTVISANLALSILDGRVSNIPQALAWLSEHRKDTQSPVSPR